MPDMMAELNAEFDFDFDPCPQCVAARLPREAPLIDLRKYVERRMAKVRRAQAMARQDRDIQIADEFEAQLSELIALEKWLFRRARGESSPCLKS